MAWRWLPTYPTTDNRLYEVPAIISENFTGIETILGIEHETLTSGGSGQHSPGRVSAVYEGTTAQIAALTDIPEGALAYDTTIGYWGKYIDGAWVVMTDVHSRMRAFLSISTSAVTASTQTSTGDWIRFDSESYDELSEFDTDPTTGGIFTAKGSGDYLVLVSVAICASAPIPTTSTPGTATGNETVQWVTVGAGTNYQAINEYPTANDADYVTTNTSGNKDRYTQSKTNQEITPLGSTGLSLTVAYRIKSIGCSCNATCYGHTCTCNAICYGYTACACDAACYGYSCTCNATCYQFTCGCTCNYTCYVYTACGCDAACFAYTGCSCDNMCYQDSKCTCYGTCYGYSCTCNNLCYGYSGCTCNYTCYHQTKSPTCYTCYGYTACSCNYTTYNYTSCTCDATCYIEGGATCQCDAMCYDEFKTTIAPLITLSGSTGWIEYLGAIQEPTSSFQLLTSVWSVSPSTGLEWLTDELNKVGHFGLKAYNDGGITTGCSAVVSQEYITFGWYPNLPVYVMRLYKNNVEVEKIFCPISDAGTESDQTIGISTILTLNPGDTLRVAFVKANNVADNIIGDATGTLTYMSIHRIEGQCV